MPRTGRASPPAPRHRNGHVSGLRIGVGTRGRAAWISAAVALLILGSVSLTLGLRTNQQAIGLPERLASPPQSTSAGSAGHHPVRTGAPSTNTHPPFPTRSRPVELRIPLLRLAVDLTTLGLNPDRTVEVPTDPSKPGWYRLGPAPGQQGSAVILGHVDSYQGPAVFYKLSLLSPGDHIAVRLANGLLTNFVVTVVKTYPNADFPARQVYGPHGYRGLQLITCGGGFDTQAQHYLGNVVVYTRLVRTSQPAGSVTG